MKCRFAGKETAVFALSLANTAAEIPSTSIKANFDSILRKVNRLLPDDLELSSFRDSIEILKPLVMAWNYSGNLGELAEGRHLRKIAYLMDNTVLSQPSILEAGRASELLDCMDKNWRDSFITPLIMIILRYIFDEKATGLASKQALEIVRRRLPQYSGSRSIPLLVRLFFEAIIDKCDPGIIAKRVNDLHLEWFAACESSHVPVHVQGTCFFGIAFIKYLQIAEKPDFYLQEAIFERISKLGDADLPKAAFAVLVKRCASSESNMQVLIRYAFKSVGDPQNGAVWHFSGIAYRVFEPILYAAREIVSTWINRQVLEYFFAHVRMDGGRKAFWSKYAPYMSMIRVAMHTNFSFGFGVGNNAEVEGWIKNRLVKVQTQTTDVGLIMEYGEWAIVEIGTLGNACYIYKRNNPLIQNLHSSIWNLPSLKRTDLPILQYYSHESEGRIIHHSDWQHNLKNILRNKMGLIV
jgi:hypothetical protein